MQEIISRIRHKAKLDELLDLLFDWCSEAEKPIVLLIDEVDSASNNQVFLDFLAQLRFQYLEREKSPAYKFFQSVILAGVTDIRNLRRKLRPDETHKVNSPWNIAADFNIDMSLSELGIRGMLDEYETDHGTGMDTAAVAREIHAFTNGYPFLVSRICQLMDERMLGGRFETLSGVWTPVGVSEAVRMILMSSNLLFDSIMGRVQGSESLQRLLFEILFRGERKSFNPYDIAISDAVMYGFIVNDDGGIKITNRIFETLLYNYFLNNEETKNSPIFRAGDNNRADFIRGGHLDMEALLERYVTVFDDLYQGRAEHFDEAEGRRRFLLFVRPVINGTGNYYIEAETRDNRRMDLVIDYLGERFVVEMKIWNGKVYHEKGEKQLADYLDALHLEKGYMLTYNFNKSKQQGLKKRMVNGRELIEAMV
ncbi:MAG: 9-O-acetyl-N-acetylneuraminate esterase [Clostridia bacterium]|nr:9-O-acetyl-N-acetylneuraminate esterase [Clostridia bacterium]